jgi:flagellar basal-body rod protein FlgB
MADEITGATAKLVEHSLRFRVARQGALASNVANADTPGYRRVDVRFEALLDQSQRALQRTHPQHLPSVSGGAGDFAVETGPRGTRPDGNGVDLERELVEVSRNAGAFTEQAAALTRLLALVRTAATGEPR